MWKVRLDVPLLAYFVALALAGCGGGGGSNRFDSLGETVLDSQTGLEWERKTADDGSTDYANPHDLDNDGYTWSSSGTAPDGTAYTLFLAQLNGSSGACYAGHCDWRLPTFDELKGITIPFPDCGAAPCVVDSELLPAAACDYWSATTQDGFPGRAWLVSLADGRVGNTMKLDSDHVCVRAVRDAD